MQTDIIKVVSSLHAVNVHRGRRLQSHSAYCNYSTSVLGYYMLNEAKFLQVEILVALPKPLQCAAHRIMRLVGWPPSAGGTPGQSGYFSSAFGGAANY